MANMREFVTRQIQKAGSFIFYVIVVVAIGVSTISSVIRSHHANRQS